MTQDPKASSDSHVQIAIDILIKVGVLFLLLAWCFRILAPFISIVIWAVILAVAIYPLYERLRKKLGRKKLPAIIITVVFLLILLIPTGLFMGSLVEGLGRLNQDIERQSFEIPPPNASVKEWPVIGSVVYDIWFSASENLGDVAQKYSKQLASAGSFILKGFMSTGLGILQFLLSIIVSGVFLAMSDRGERIMNRLFIRLAGERGKEFADIAGITVRNVAKGVLGVAIIQATAAGLIFVIAGVPYSGLWALICLILCIIQVGPGLVIIPVIIYLFSSIDPVMATIWSILLIVVMLIDNVLKPILMGQGAKVPMMVIFIGALGGFMAFGFIGLFLGAIILSLGYILFMSWIEN